MDASRRHRGWQLLRYFGPRWLMYRAFQALRMKSGLVAQQLPVSTWAQNPLSRFLSDPHLGAAENYAVYRRTQAPRFFFDPNQMASFCPYFQKWDTAESSPLSAADEIANGFIQFFSHEQVDVGFPPRWHDDPFSQYRFPSDRHWSRIADFGAGDIKLVWETNRFGFVFPLARAYWRTGREEYAETFWQLVEDWQANNPPQAGANWKCGQEISLRVMAWCFGLYGFQLSSASTAERIAKLAQMIAVSGRRIESNIGYALSQQNNHGISEAMGLWTIGCLFPEFTESARWAKVGRRLLENQARQLIYDDGAFSQHSMNYHRVMLHDYLWSMKLADIAQNPFSEELRKRIGRAGEFVYQLQDESTGQVPCYGQNDGALILPLTNCDYRDFRPIVQSIHVLTTGKPRLQAGPWDEESVWMGRFFPHAPDETRNDNSTLHGGSKIVVGPHWNKNSSSTSDCNEFGSRCDFDALVGGYSTLRSSNGFLLTRAGNFRHRPAQADLLHVDLWWHGLNMAIDAGTYSYNAQPPWDNRLSHTASHNTVTVDGQDQMERAGRFLWLPWANGRSFGRRVPCHGDVSCWNGEHDGYSRLADPVVHRRGIVRIGADHWLIVDALEGRKPHSYRLHWLLMDVPYEVDERQQSLELQTPAGCYRVATASSARVTFDVVRAATDSVRGWCSPYYHSREPAISVSLEAADTKIVFATVLGPDAQSPILVGNTVQVSGPDWNASATLDLSKRFGIPLITSVVASGLGRNSDSTLENSFENTLVESHQCTSC